MKQTDSKSLVVRLGERFGVDPEKLLDTLKATAFRQSDKAEITNEQMMALLAVSEQYNLNPFTKEIYAFPDKQGKGIIPVVGVDGWSRIVNANHQYDGVEFRYAETSTKMPGTEKPCPEWIDTIIYRKDRNRPTVIREYLDEVYRAPFNGKQGPWQTHPKRQLRHKGFIQCARIALGFVGIYDQDESERIIEGEFEAQSYELNEVGNDKPLQIDRQQLDPLLEKLIERAEQSNAWEAAHQYVRERFSGGQLEYATQFLREKEIDFMEPPQVNVGDYVADDESSTQETFEPVAS